jgi:carboxyl-terminal processing protease
MLTRTTKFLLVLGAAALTAGALLGSVRAASGELSPSVDHKRATALITKLMSRYHYKRTPLDDGQSALVLERYLDSLDPNRSFFLQSDIDAFGNYRDSLDDHLLDGSIQPAFQIFEVFQRRLDDRIAYAIGLLDAGFDFSLDEFHEFDRSESPWARDEAQINDLWRRRVKNDVLNLRLTNKEPEEIDKTLRERYQRLGKRNKQLNANDVYGLFMNAYTSSVEPHTAYFSPRTSENFKIRMSLSLEGIGAVLQRDSDYTLVRSVVPGGPAARSQQLNSGDRITGVGQGVDEEMVDVIGWRLDDVVDLIRGPKGTVVRLQILPKDVGPEGPGELITLIRNRIELEEQAAQKSVQEIPAEDRAYRIGIIEVPTFYSDFSARARGDKNYRSTTRDVHRLLLEFREEKVDGIVIDLRGNGGGSLAEVTELTGLFIDTGPVVQVRDSMGQIEIKRDPEPGAVYTGPLAVLVDRHSASASEIFAGAIQDYRRGIVIGEPTFGKGTVQTLIDLDRFTQNSTSKLGQLKVTIAQFFRISGGSTQNRGVVPDIVFPTAGDSEEQGERALDHALPWASVTPIDYRLAANLERSIASARSQHQDRSREDPAFDLLIEQTALLTEAANRNSISLNEDRRRAEREADDKRRDDLTSRLREVRGLAPEITETESNETEDSAAAHEAESTEGDDASDILLEETARILTDMIRWSRANAAPDVHTASRF